MPHRKTATYLNQLRLDLEDTLNEISLAGEDLDTFCHDLSRIVPHDVKTDSADVKERFDAVLDMHGSLGNLLDKFRIARNKYLEFF